MNFFLDNDFSLLESCQLYTIAKYKASSCCKIEALMQRCFVKKEFLKILQNSPENEVKRPKSLKAAKYQFQLFLTAPDIMDPLYIVSK